MRQLWPLNRASLETGPFFPFDNGPNGVNTLVAPQWLTRWVPLSHADCIFSGLQVQAFHVCTTKASKQTSHQSVDCWTCLG